MCGSAPLAGRFGIADTFGGVLESFALLCIHVCMADVSVWSLACMYTCLMCLFDP